MIVGKIRLPASSIYSAYVQAHGRFISISAPVWASIKDAEEELVDLRRQFANDKAEVVRTPIEQPKYYKDIERYIKSQRKGGAAMEGKNSVQAELQQSGAIHDNDISDASTDSSFKLSSPSLAQMPGGVESSCLDGQAVIPAKLDDITGWGAHWQQGGTASIRNQSLFKPTYAQGMGDRERYIGYLKTNPLQYYPNRSQGVDAKGPVPDHTRSWAKSAREVVPCRCERKSDDRYLTGLVDEWGNSRGRLQRWPTMEIIPKKKFCA